MIVPWWAQTVGNGPDLEDVPALADNRKASKLDRPTPLGCDRRLDRALLGRNRLMLTSINVGLNKQGTWETIQVPR